MVEWTRDDLPMTPASIAAAKSAQHAERAQVTARTGLVVTDEPIVIAPLLVSVAMDLCEARKS